MKRLWSRRPRPRGRRLPFPLGPTIERRLRFLLVALASLLALDWIFPPPLERGRVVSAVVSDRDGGWLRAFLTPSGAWRLQARASEIDPEFLRRLIAIEDARFYWHPGVDPLAIARACLNWARSGQVSSGGSTITMQLARLIEPRPRTAPSKIVEIVRAAQIERRLSKREILEMYLTLAPYGGNLEGVRAASRAYFGRDPQGLSDAEMALLIALPQAPEARRPDRRPEAARAARDAMLRKFAAQGLISQRHAAEGRASALPVRAPFPVRAPALAARLVSRDPGRARIASTLDGMAQAALERLLEERLAAKGPDVSAALMAVDLKTREVRAYVSGAGWGRDGRARAGGYLDMAQAARSPGSTLKPFIYALAFDDGVIAPETLMEDAPRRFEGYMPENFDRRFHGEVRAAEALKYSLNLPAVALLDRVGAARFEAALTRAGAKPRLPRRELVEPGLALALGGVGMTLEELATLYAALGDGGEARPLVYEPAHATWAFGARLMRPETAKTVLSILAATPAPRGRAPAGILAAAPSIAFKTGTSYGFRDAWAAGVGADYAVVVWVGRPDGAPRPGASGRDEALPLLFDAFDRLTRRGAGAAGAAIAAFESRRAPSGLGRFSQAEDAPSAPLSILFPPDGADVMVEAVGPGSRGLSLSARGGRGRLIWYAEGEQASVEPTSGRSLWRPSAPGFHTLMVVDEAGRRAQARVRVRLAGGG